MNRRLFKLLQQSLAILVVRVSLVFYITRHGFDYVFFDQLVVFFNILNVIVSNMLVYL